MKIKNVKSIAAVVLSLAVVFTGISVDAMAADKTAKDIGDIFSTSQNDAASTEVPAGYYRNELTNEPILESLRDTRPVAIMIDNEKTALPHFGVNQADIVYEMINSTANGRITRLMCIYKDWTKLTQVGSIRSARPTNFMISPEYNAIVCHDGGPYYINQYVKKKYIDNLSGGFARFSNGKPTEYTEYVTFEGYTNPKTKKQFLGLWMRIYAKKYTFEYNDYSLYKSQSHFNFSDTEYTLDAKAGVKSGIGVTLPFPHNSTKLVYNATTKTYDYYEYGSAHIDEIDNKITTFKNVIIMCADMEELDKNGYMQYDVFVNNNPGYYLTDGKMIPITWTKTEDKVKTEYYELDGTPLTINTGKTYIAIVPTDAWKKVDIK